MVKSVCYFKIDFFSREKEDFDIEIEIEIDIDLEEHRSRLG